MKLSEKKSLENRAQVRKAKSVPSPLATGNVLKTPFFVAAKIESLNSYGQPWPPLH